MEPLFDQLARGLFSKTSRYKRRLYWIVLALGISCLWWFASAYIDLSTDDGNADAHPVLEAASNVVNFPLSYLPGIESWDGQSHWMSLEAFGWYETIGDTMNCLLWGFFLAWLLRFVWRQNPMKRYLYLTLLIVTVIGGCWAALPYFTYKLPDPHENWSNAYYAKVLREIYPWHVLNPAWFIYGIHWRLAETFARLSILIIVLAVIVVVGRLIQRKRPPATVA